MGNGSLNPVPMGLTQTVKHAQVGLGPYGDGDPSPCLSILGSSVDGRS